MYNIKEVYYAAIRRCNFQRIVRQNSTVMRQPVSVNIRNFEFIPKIPGLPYLGNWHLYKLGIFDGSKYHEVLQRMYEKYGPLVIEQIGWRQPILHVFEPEDADVIFKNEDNMPYIFPVVEATHISRKSIDFMSPGPAHTNGEEWYRVVRGIRKLMMRPNSMQQYVPDILETTDEAVREIERNIINDRERSVRNFKTILGKWHLKSTSNILIRDQLFDECAQDVYDELSNANKDALHLNRVLKFSLPFHRYWITPTSLKLDKREKYICNIIKTNVEKVIDKIEGDFENETWTKKKDYSFLTALLRSDILHRKDVMSVAMSFIMDGSYTMIPMLLNVIYALAKNQDVQKKTFEEIQTVANGSNSLSKEMLSDLVYLKAVIKETFRMYPNGTERTRINKKPLVLSGYHIPAETQLRLNMTVNFRSEKHFSQPNVFKPERWMRNEQNDNSHSVLMQASFGAGARSCIGRRYAELAMRTLLCRILQEFQLKLPANHHSEPEFIFDTFLAPAGDSPVQFHRRH